MNKITLMGMDTAEKVFHLVGVGASGEYEWRRKLRRKQLLPALAPGMRFVGVKRVDQQAEQALHRVRSRLLSQRKAAANGCAACSENTVWCSPRASSGYVKAHVPLPRPSRLRNWA